MKPFDLLSPETGNPLEADGPHVLRDSETGARWPVLDGIPYLRVGRADLIAATLDRIDKDRISEALVGLLADQDDWWNGPPADSQALARLVAERDSTSLRKAVDGLGWGRVGEYFVNRWSDPTYLAGLTLLEAHWNEPSTAFELACGIGHYLREMQGRGVEVAGADVVFAKLWVARHWVVGKNAVLVCFDAASPHWPLAETTFDLVLCNDAFYFLDDKPSVVACLRKMAGEEGWLAISHIHNRGCPGFSSGKAVSASDIEDLFPDALVYDDAELTRALVELRAPTPRGPHEIEHCEAFSLVAGAGMRPAPRSVIDGITLPPAGTALRLNPLYKPDLSGAYVIRWPSERYAAEYGGRVTYPLHSAGPGALYWRGGPDTPVAERVRRREFVDLPERW